MNHHGYTTREIAGILGISFAAASKLDHPVRWVVQARLARVYPAQ